MSRSEHFEHAADVGVRGRGATVEEAFAGAAEALFRLVAADLASVEPRASERFRLEAGDLEALLVAYLNELIFLYDARRLVFSRFELSIQGGPPWTLSGTALGEPLDLARHQATVDPKGATFTALRVVREQGEWLAQCVVDV